MLHLLQVLICASVLAQNAAAVRNASIQLLLAVAALHSGGFFLGYTVDANSVIPNELITSDIDLIIRESPRLWQALWEVRTPFLDSLPRKVQGSLERVPPPSVRFTFSSFAALLGMFEKKRRSVTHALLRRGWR